MMIFLGHALMILEGIGINIYLWWSLPMIIVFIHSMAPHEALYNRRFTSPIGLFLVGESSLLGSDLIYKTL